MKSSCFGKDNSLKKQVSKYTTLRRTTHRVSLSPTRRCGPCCSRAHHALLSITCKRKWKGDAVRDSTRRPLPTGRPKPAARLLSFSTRRFCSDMMMWEI